MKSAELIQNMHIKVQGLPEPHKCPWLMQYLLASPIRKLLEPPRRLVGPFVKPGMTVAEPGCGFGLISLELARLVGKKGKVISVDLEPRAAERLKKRAGKAGLAERMDIRACESRDLGIADYEDRIDLIAVVHTLHEFEDLPGFLAQAAALLRSSGHLLVVEPKGHVSLAEFQAEMECCKLAGFEVLETPDISRRSMTALLAPPVA